MKQKRDVFMFVLVDFSPDKRPRSGSPFANDIMYFPTGDILPIVDRETANIEGPFCDAFLYLVYFVRLLGTPLREFRIAFVDPVPTLVDFVAHKANVE